MTKSAEAFRTISEVSELLDTPTHVLRFWESKFSQIKPLKRAGGRRYYRPADVALIAGIKELLQGQSLPIKEAQAALKAQGVRAIAALGAAALEAAGSRGGDQRAEVAAAPEAVPETAATDLAPEPHPETEAPEATEGQAIDEAGNDADVDPEPAPEAPWQSVADATPEPEPEPERDTEAEERALEAAQAAVEMARREAEAVRRELARLRAEAERARAAAARLAALSAVTQPEADTDTGAPETTADADGGDAEDDGEAVVDQSPGEGAITAPEVTFSHRASSAPLHDRLSAMVAEAVAEVIVEAILPEDARDEGPQEDAHDMGGGETAASEAPPETGEPEPSPASPFYPEPSSELGAETAPDQFVPPPEGAVPAPPQTAPEDEAYSFVAPRAPKSGPRPRAQNTAPTNIPAADAQPQWHQPSLFDYLPAEVLAKAPLAETSPAEALTEEALTEDAVFDAVVIEEVFIDAVVAEDLAADLAADLDLAAALPARPEPHHREAPPAPEVDPLERVVSLILSGSAPLQTELTPAGQIDPTANPLGALRAGLAHFAPPTLSPIERMRLLAAHDRLQALHTRLGQPPRAPVARR